MIKKCIFFSLVFISLVCLTKLTTSQAVFVPQQAETPPLKLSLSEIPDAQYSVTNIPIKVTFENVGKNPLRLANIFDRPGNLVPLFFRLMMDKVDKTNSPFSFDAGGAGKVAFSAARPLEYITLGPGQRYEFTINLKDWLVWNREPFENGTYKIMMSYQNHYGKDCFKGLLETDTPLYLRLWLTDK